MTHKPLTFGPLELAQEFLKRLQLCIGKRKFREVCRLNADTNDPTNVCHSHDFCDANMIMAPAFRKLAGREVWMPSDVEEGNCNEVDEAADIRLWNAGWAFATSQTIFLHRNKIIVTY